MLTQLATVLLISPFGQFGFGNLNQPPPAQQGPRAAQVRVLNAIVDQQLVTIRFGEYTISALPYGQRSDYVDVEIPRPTAIVSTVRGERLTNETPIPVQPGYPHTIIFTGAVAMSGRFTPIIVRDSTAGRPSASSSQVMFVNAMSDGSAVSIKMNGNTPARYRALGSGAQTAFVSYGPREYDVSLEDANGKELFATKFRAMSGTRYTAVAMGSANLQGNRAPRVFFYSF